MNNLDNHLTTAWMNAKLHRLVMPYINKGSVVSHQNKITIRSHFPIINLFFSIILEEGNERKCIDE